jgi:putative NADPH-quinone reductase
VLLVSCHPRDDSFNAHLRDRALRALASHEVRHLDLYRTDDPPDAGEALLAAEALVLVYPTWWSSVPAPLVAWLDDALSSTSRFPDLRVVAAVTSHGSGRIVNLVEGEVGRRVIRRGLPRRAHRRCRTHWISLYAIDRASDEDRRRFVAKMERRLGRLR